jgi:hypothetical protein
MSEGDVSGKTKRISRPTGASSSASGNLKLPPPTDACCDCGKRCMLRLENEKFAKWLQAIKEDIATKTHEQSDNMIFHMMRDMRKAQEAFRT